MPRSSGRRSRATRTSRASSPSGAGSGLEDLLLSQCRSAGLPEPERQAALVPLRRFRWDFYWPQAKLGVEVNGGLWLPRGAHSGGSGTERDYEKAALGALQGVWTLFVSGRQIKSGQALGWIEALLHRSGVS